MPRNNVFYALTPQGLLLADAVNCTKSINQINTANPNNFSGWEQILQNPERCHIVFVVKGWHKNLLVADVEVCVACW